MGITTFVPLGGVVVMTAAARFLPWRRLPPRAALWILGMTGLLGAVAVVAAVGVVAGGFLLGTPAGAWLIKACSLFAGHHRVPPAFGGAAFLASLAIAWRVGGVLRSARAQRTGGFDPLTVLHDEVPIAFARPGRKGGVVVSTGMLGALRPAERRVLFAHERAHVRSRHDLHLLVHEVCRAVVPWLGALGPELRLAAERTADAAALAEVRGDRRLVATAIARAALAVDEHRGRVAAMAFIGGSTAFRVQSMLRPASGWTAGLSSITGTTAIVGLVSVLTFLHHLAVLLAHICI